MIPEWFLDNVWVPTGGITRASVIVAPYPPAHQSISPALASHPVVRGSGSATPPRSSAAVEQVGCAVRVAVVSTGTEEKK
jgi:hypothetical protein